MQNEPDNTDTSLRLDTPISPKGETVVEVNPVQILVNAEQGDETFSESDKNRTEINGPTSPSGDVTTQEALVPPPEQIRSGAARSLWQKLSSGGLLRFKRLDRWLEGKLAAIVVGVLLIVIVFLMRTGKRYYQDPVQMIEAFIVVLMAAISTFNFGGSGKRIEALQREYDDVGDTRDSTTAVRESTVGGVSFKNELLNNVYTLLNVGWFILALFLLSWKDKPYWYVSAVLLIFLTFTSSNLWQAKRLRLWVTRWRNSSGESHPDQTPILTPENLFTWMNARTLDEVKSACKEIANGRTAPLQTSSRDPRFSATGTFLLDVANWLRLENGPSMVAYSILIAIMGIALRWRWWPIDLLGAYAAGAATFHLTVSVCVFWLTLRNNPWEHVVNSVDWMQRDGDLLHNVVNCAEGSSRFWRKALIASVVASGLFLVGLCVPYTKPASQGAPAAESAVGSQVVAPVQDPKR